MKKLIMLFTALLIMTTIAFADGNPNIDGGGGDVGDGDVGGGSYWNVGDDGVRVTIVDVRYDPKPIRALDFSNKSITVDFYFGLKSKITYRNSQLEMKLGGNYKAITPDNPLPQIISASGGANINAVKAYFGTEGTIKDISEKTGIDYDFLISGDFVLLLEPVIYVKYVGRTIAMTATEAALYDQAEDGKEWVNGSHSSSCLDDCDMSHGSWEDNGKWVDHGEWVDKGNWEYDWENHSASLSVTTKIAPADEVPTAKKLSTGRWEIKSGYGVVVDVQSSVSTSAKHSDVTPVQNGIAQFSEFHYEDYFRRLVCTPNGLRSSLAFDYNKYSFMGASVHYTPIWYPDRSIYSTKVTVFDVWTPAGQLYYSNGDYLNIDGDVYDDWNVSPYIGE